MASNYTGNPAGTQSPGAPPLPGTFPVVSVPADGDPLAAASVAQMAKENADYNAYHMQPGLQRVWQENYFMYPGNITSTGLNVITDYPYYATNINNSGSVDFTQGMSQAGYTGNVIKISTGTTLADFANISLGGGVFNRTLSGVNNQQIQFEQTVAIMDTTKGDYRFGLVDSTTGLTNFAGLIHIEGATVWQLVTAAGTVNVTGSTATNNVAQTFRIVYSGSATPLGVANSNTAIVNVYYNGGTSAAATQSGAFLTGGTSFFPFQDSRCVTGTKAAQAKFGGFTISWNTF